MKRKANAASAVEERIGYRFADATLLERALTHSSALSAGSGRSESYQRLEFLGDRVLGLAVADMLLRAFPQATEGELSRRLADLVRAESCAAVARAMQLDSAIQFGTTKGARARLTQTILADACEAVIGAVFLDGGYAAAAALVERFWRERMLAPPRPLRDSKTVLQEWAQGRGLPTPLYREVARSGPHHDPRFRVTVELPDLPPAEGTGRSKRAAEQAAAAAMLQREGVVQDDGYG
ncbi:MAG: ribonuclease III [Variibacter sp.]|nr:ribonuclease III [Variibacter sp.]